MSKPATRKPVPTNGTNAARPPVPRGADELEFMPSRQKTTPKEAHAARQETVDLARRVVEADATLALESWEQGRILNELYLGHVDVVLGFRRWGDYIDRHWPLESSVARERMRVARLVTKAEATRHGFTACQLGLRIMDRMGVASIERFLATDLPLPAAEGGGTTRFPAPTRRLRAVLRALATPPTPADEGDHVVRRVRAYRAVVGELIEADREVAALKPAVWCDHRDAYVRATVSGPDQAKAGIRLLQRLARVR